LIFINFFLKTQYY